MEVIEQLVEKFGVHGLAWSEPDSLPTTLRFDFRQHAGPSDVVPIATPDHRFALKIYSHTRAPEDVRWEVELVRHLAERGVSVARPVDSRNSGVEVFTVNGRKRPCVLFEWAPGEKPAASAEVYGLLGTLAAQIHRAADIFQRPSNREVYDADCLIDRQLQLMEKHLVEAGRWLEATKVGARLKRLISSAALERGICHMDLTLDNVHLEGETLTAFDFDSAGECWRALEPHAALRSCSDFYRAWLQAYRSVRIFSEEDEQAGRAFAIMSELRAVAWKLGVAASSRGPMLNASDLPPIVDEWTALDI